METNISVSDQLRRVLADVRNPRYRDHLQSIKNSRLQLDPEAFRLLFAHDTSWGLFGERKQHFDTQLGVVALTDFVIHERETAMDADDVALCVTPIYRVLLTLTALTLREEAFETFASRDLVLPMRPKPGVDMGRYSSLLDVACSLWLEVCHAYVRVTEPWLISELYCFNADQNRSHTLWVDYSPKDCSVTVKYNTLDESHLKAGFLVLGPDESSTEPSQHVLCLQASTSVPYVDLVWATDRCSFFLLVTCNGGHYVSFHRTVRGRTRRYPLWIHAVDPAAVDVPRNACATCGKFGEGVTLKAREMDPQAGNLYCSVKCQTKMDEIRQLQALAAEEANRQKAARLRLPPF